jgi:hypothetical protein
LRFTRTDSREIIHDACITVPVDITTTIAATATMAENLASWLLDGDPSTTLRTINKHGKYHRSCWLCGTGVFNSKQTQHHRFGKKHQSLQTALSDMKALKFRKDTFVSPSILASVEKITHLAWKRHLKSLLFDFVVTGKDGATSTQEKILSLLHRYHYIEKLSLLEMALWKAKLESENQEMYGAVDRDFCRKNCGSQVVVPLIMEFLPEG